MSCTLEDKGCRQKLEQRAKVQIGSGKSMKNYGKIPCVKVNGCRLKAGSCRTIRDFVCATCKECLAEGKKPSASTFFVRQVGEKFHILTSREAEICSQLAYRFNTAEIATRLLVSPRTVEKHIESIFKKLEVGSREQLRDKLGAFRTLGLRH
jgi:DNA-binding CsgD family transcriptional regulator